MASVLVSFLLEFDRSLLFPKIDAKNILFQFSQICICHGRVIFKCVLLKMLPKLSDMILTFQIQIPNNQMYNCGKL